MSTLLITDIEQLRETVKMNAVVPFESIAPFIADATDIYLEPNVGISILEKAETDESRPECRFRVSPKKVSEPCRRRTESCRKDYGSSASSHCARSPSM